MKIHKVEKIGKGQLDLKHEREKRKQENLNKKDNFSNVLKRARKNIKK